MSFSLVYAACRKERKFLFYLRSSTVISTACWCLANVSFFTTSNFVPYTCSFLHLRSQKPQIVKIFLFNGISTCKETRFCQLHSPDGNECSIHQTCYVILTYPQDWNASHPWRTSFELYYFGRFHDSLSRTVIYELCILVSTACIHYHYEPSVWLLCSSRNIRREFSFDARICFTNHFS